MDFKPFGNYILVKPEDKKETTKSGLFIPETSQEAPQQGKVVSVGTGIGITDMSGNPIPMQTKVGDTVIFPKYSGTKITLGGVEFIVLRETEILGTIE